MTTPRSGSGSRPRSRSRPVTPTAPAGTRPKPVAAGASASSRVPPAAKGVPRPVAPVNRPPVNARASTQQQRRRQRELIEVRVRPQHAGRRRQQRVVVWLCGLVLLLAAAGGVYLAATKGMKRLFFENPDYNVATLEVLTDGVLAREAVLATAEVHEGQNIFRINLDQAKTRLEALPQVQRARVERRLPSKISIQITERKPVAWVPADPRRPAASRQELAAAPGTLLVDAEGYLLRPKKLLAQDYQLPLIWGANPERYAPGQRVDTEEMRAALEMLRAYQTSVAGGRFRVSDVDLSKGYGLWVTDASNQLQVLFGLDSFELQWKTLHNLLQNVDRAGHRPATISLMTLVDRQRNIPVTFQPDPTPAPPGQAAAGGDPGSAAAPAHPAPAGAGAGAEGEGVAGPPPADPAAVSAVPLPTPLVPAPGAAGFNAGPTPPGREGSAGPAGAEVKKSVPRRGGGGGPPAHGRRAAKERPRSPDRPRRVPLQPFH